MGASALIVFRWKTVPRDRLIQITFCYFLLFSFDVDEIKNNNIKEIKQKFSLYYYHKRYPLKCCELEMVKIL